MVKHSAFLKEHQRIIFEGDGYSSSWEEEAKRRGLPCRKNTVEAIEVLKDKEYELRVSLTCGKESNYIKIKFHKSGIIDYVDDPE